MPAAKNFPPQRGQSGRPSRDPGGPLWKTLLIFLIPLVLSNTLQSLSSTVGSIYFGRLIGVQALAAVSTFFPLLFFLISFLIGIGSGSTVLIGQAYGAGKQDYLKAVAAPAAPFSGRRFFPSFPSGRWKYPPPTSWPAKWGSTASGSVTPWPSWPVSCSSTVTTARSGGKDDTGG